MPKTDLDQTDPDALAAARMTVKILISVKDAVIEQMSYEARMPQDEIKELLASGHKNAQKRFGEYLDLARKSFSETWSTK